MNPPQAIRRVVALPRDVDVSDAELVVRVRGGDRFAEDILVRRHLPGVAATVARLLGDRHEAEDVVQDAFAAAHAELKNLREPSAFRGWVLQMAVRKVHRRFRKRKLLRFLGLASGEPEGLSELAGAEATQEQRAELVFLDRALGLLAAADRVAWSLRYVEGMQLDEVADHCGCSLATAKRRIAAADVVVRKHAALDTDERGEA